MTQHIAIVGGSGFIGWSIASYLSSQYEVTIIDKAPPHNSSGSSFIECDITKIDDVQKALANMDLVIDTAIVQIPQINQEKRLGYEVNVIGTQNICEVVRRSPTAKGLIVTGSWHTIGERQIVGVVDEKFGFRPDLVEERARMYALSKIAQESIVRLYDEIESKTFGVIRIGTALGDKMQPKSAANIFIENGLKGEPLTPFSHSMYRPMLFVDVNDVCVAFASFAHRILSEPSASAGSSLLDIYNVYYPEPFTILDLAEMVRDSFRKITGGRIDPEIRIVNTEQQAVFSKDDKSRMSVDASKAQVLLDSRKLTHPRDTIDRIVANRISLLGQSR
jgi:UDP-glucose 4-epimerase